MSMTRHGGIQYVRYLCYDFAGKRYNRDKIGEIQGIKLTDLSPGITGRKQGGTPS